MEKPWKVILAFIGVFAAGAIFGGLFTVGIARKIKAEARATAPAQPAKSQPPRKIVPPPTTANTTASTPAPSSRGLTPVVMRQLTQRLSPTPEQQRAIRLVVTRASEDWQRLGREHITDVQRVTDRMYDDISALLSPEQRTQLEKMRQETLEKARQERLKRTAPPEPPKEGANPSTLPRTTPAPAPTK